jgi:hypothetical protein
VQQDVGGTTTLVSIRAAGEAVYPLFFCKSRVPTAEPSCVPYRDTYKDGITSGDSDGDGVPNATDACPTVFDPVRLLDDGKQADADGDGAGDACDPCPLDAKDACKRPLAGDADGDGIANGADDCPDVADASQDDADKDGRGDACDGCGDANPGATACATLIPTVRNPAATGHHKIGTVVNITGAYVTAAKSSSGFYVQTADNPAVPWGGLYVPSGPLTSKVKVGNKVSFHGVYAEVFAMSEVTPAALTVDDPGTALPFAPLATAPADFADATKGEPYESILLTISGGFSITNDNPDAPGKFYEFVVNNSLRVDDQIWTRFGTPANGPYPPTAYVNGTAFNTIVGIGGYSFNNHKLWPRSAADFQ